MEFHHSAMCLFEGISSRKWLTSKDIPASLIHVSLREKPVRHRKTMAKYTRQQSPSVSWWEALSYAARFSGAA